MLKDVKWSDDGTYTPQGEHTPFEFFTNALENSIEFDIQLGYFNSAAINILSTSFATFILNGGRMRMAINQIVSKEDKETITEGFAGGIDAPFNIYDWTSIKKALDEYGEHFFKCLAYLIQEKRIELQIIKPKSTSGIAHTKRGQFIDSEGTIVGFSGSANFTLGGMFNNLEDINIFLGTSPDATIQKKISNQKVAFNNIMKRCHSDVEYLSPDDLMEAIRSSYGDQSIDELLDVEKKLKEYKRKLTKKKIFHSGHDIETLLPCFPYPSGPRDYQQLAFDNWKNNGQKGLFAMATGTGKTITSLNCLLEIYKRCGYYKAIILVPTITLVNQWASECLKFNFSRIIKVCSKYHDWKEKLEEIIFSEKYRKENEPTENFVIISTYASFIREHVFAMLNGFERKKVLFIADEAHNMGAPGLIKLLPMINYLRRIGLSATPERQFDDATNKKLFKFFGAEEQYTYEYSMEEAIKNGVLCKYYYYPHVVKLTSDEMDKYAELSLKIAKYFNFNTGAFDKKDDILTALLLARKRIIHKAYNKLEAFKRIIHERYEEKGNLKYTLIYVPEGNKPDYIIDSDIHDKSEQVDDDTDSEHLIDIYTEAIMKIDKFMTVKKFVSGQKDREAILNDFAIGKLQVLTSMKCLDEGVDVPRSEMAIFCSSTGNPRQFIQRRGRVLRKHHDKHIAILHDLVVAPIISPNSESYKMEQMLFKSELERVRNFSLLSENPAFSQMELYEIMIHYGLNLYNNNHIL